MNQSGTDCKILERSVRNRASRACKGARVFGQICKYGYLKYTNAAFICIHLDD